MTTNAVFSEFEVDECVFTIGTGVEKAQYDVECIGKLTDEMTVRTVTKNCRGIVSKRVTKGTGNGTGTVTAHIPMELFNKLHGMENAALKEGVTGYGYDSTHPECCITGHVIDEDGNEKYIAYPVAVVNAGPKRNIENGGTEVAEVEINFDFMPDTNGIGRYEALASGLDKTIADSWMTAFTPALVLKTA